MNSILRFVLAMLLCMICVSGELRAQESGELPPEATEAEPEMPEPPEQLSDLDLDTLFSRLAAAEEGDAVKISKEINRRWSQSGSDTIDLLLTRGRKAIAAGQLDKAISHFSRLIAFAPEYSEGWNARATAHFANGDFGFALADVYYVLRLEPRHYGAMTGLGIMLEQLGMKDDAFRAYSAALEVHPHLESAKKGVERLREDVEGEPI